MKLLRYNNPDVRALRWLFRRWEWHTTRVTLAALAAFALVAIGVSAGIALRRSLPDVSAIFNPPAETTRIFARDGRLIASLFRENRAFLPLSEIPQVMQQAVIAIEDERFYQHHGVDVRGTLRAVRRNVAARQVIEGGSTITQQLARNLFLTRKREIGRKLAEMILALEIERRLTKHEILERYLNQVYFGHGAYGVELAAFVYFDKPARDLTLAESALLAAVIRGPSIYSLYQNFPQAKERQVVVLQRMTELGYLTKEQAQAAASQTIRLVKERNAGLVGVRATYFVSYILPYLLERYGEDLVYNGGLRVYTTLDFEMQSAAEKAVREGLDARGDKLHITEGALVAIEPSTGYIRALVGGYDFNESQFNRAWQARRQPGSAFKPFIYVTAVASGMPPTKIIDDAPVEYPDPITEIWAPKNYDESFRGPVSLRYALERSINIPAVKTLAELGPEKVITYAKRMGIKSPLQPNLSLALGSNEVTPLEMASAFGTLAALGVRAEPIAIKKVVDRSGQVLEENEPRQELALSPEVAYVMTDLLKGVIAHGTGRAAAIGRPAAGKTGTTDDYRNAWFIGYTPQLVTAVWVGNDDNSPMNKVVGATVPAPIWAAFMREATRSLPPDDWVVPPGVVVATICGTTGLLATNECADPRREVFVEGTAPTEYAAGTGVQPSGAAAAGAAGSSGAPAPLQPSQPSLPLILTAPVNGAIVLPPFTIEGTTTPGVKVTISIAVRDGALATQVEQYVTAARRDGRFKYEFQPSQPATGAQYIITVTVSLRTGESQTATITVSESAAPDTEPKD